MSDRFQRAGSACEREYYNSPDPTRSRQWSRCRDHFVSTGKNFSVPFSSVLDKAKQHFVHIAIDENVVCGSPRIAGTRIPVYMVLDAIQHHGDLDGALISYPQLSREQVREAVRFAAEVLEYAVEYESETPAR